MAIPNEILLDILHPLDYSSLLRLKCTASRYYHVVERSTANLAMRQELTLAVWPAQIRLLVDDDVIFRVNYRSSWWSCAPYGSFEEALTATAAVVALHPIVSVQLWCKAIMSGLADAIFDYLPSAAYARDVNPYGISQAAITKAHIHTFIARFLNLGAASLDGIHADFDWTILRSQFLLWLTEVRISPETDFLGRGKGHLTETAVEEIIRFCCDFSKLPPEQTKLFGLRRQWQFSHQLVSRVIQAAESSLRQFTFYVDLQLLDISREEKAVPGYDGLVFFPRIDLREDRFEHRLLSVHSAFADGRRWADVAYYSRLSSVAVFVTCKKRKCPSDTDSASVRITNDPGQKEHYE